MIAKLYNRPNSLSSLIFGNAVRGTKYDYEQNGYSSDHPKVSIENQVDEDQSEISIELPKGVYAGSSIGFKFETLP